MEGRDEVLGNAMSTAVSHQRFYNQLLEMVGQAVQQHHLHGGALVGQVEELQRRLASKTRVLTDKPVQSEEPLTNFSHMSESRDSELLALQTQGRWRAETTQPLSSNATSNQQGRTGEATDSLHGRTGVKVEHHYLSPRSCREPLGFEVPDRALERGSQRDPWQGASLDPWSRPIPSRATEKATCNRKARARASSEELHET